MPKENVSTKLLLLYACAHRNLTIFKFINTNIPKQLLNDELRRKAVKTEA